MVRLNPVHSHASEARVLTTVAKWGLLGIKMQQVQHFNTEDEFQRVRRPEFTRGPRQSYRAERGTAATAATGISPSSWIK